MVPEDRIRTATERRLNQIVDGVPGNQTAWTGRIKYVLDLRTIVSAVRHQIQIRFAGPQSILAFGQFQQLPFQSFKDFGMSRRNVVLLWEIFRKREDYSFVTKRCR